MKLLKNRIFKYGSLAVALTVTVIAVVIVINAIFSGLSYRYLWYADMTTEKLFTLSDDSRALLDVYENYEDFNITINFCMPEDQIEEEYYLTLVHNMAKQYDLEYDFIDIKYHDIITHPDSVDHLLATSVSKPKTTSVIVSNGFNESRIYTMDTFYTFSSNTGDVFAFNGEKKFTAAIIQLSGDNPIAYFTEGHGETTETSELYAMFTEAGYQVKLVDLTVDNIDDESAKVLIINNPSFDFMGDGDSVNEIKKVDEFLDKRGSLMVFLDAQQKELPELEEFLSEWGITFEDKVLRDYSHALSVDGTEIVAEYSTEGIGAQIHEGIRGLESVPKAIANYARPITLTFDEYEYRKTGVVLSTSSEKTAEAFSLSDTDGTGTPGVYDLMVVCAESRYIDNELHTNYVLAAGTSSFTDSKYIGGRTYANGEIIYSVMKAFGKETVPLDIEFKVFDNEALDITTEEATTWTVIYTAFLPAVVFAVAAVVYIRRRHL